MPGILMPIGQSQRHVLRLFLVMSMLLMQKLFVRFSHMIVTFSAELVHDSFI